MILAFLAVLGSVAALTVFCLHLLGIFERINEEYHTVTVAGCFLASLAVIIGVMHLFSETSNASGIYFICGYLAFITIATIYIHANRTDGDR